MLCGLCVALPLRADQYWVLGSYRDPDAAREQAARLAARLDEPVTWKRFERGAAPPVYRVLMPYPDGGERDEVGARVRAAGVETPWWLVVDGPSAPPAMPARERVPTSAEEEPDADAAPSEGVHVLIGSYGSLQASIAAEEKLDRAFTGVRTESGLANGRLRYRILLGPVAPEDVDRVFARLRELGFEDAREIEVDSAPGSFLDYVDVRDRFGTPMLRDAQGNGEQGEAGDAVDADNEEKGTRYNPATLREERPKFRVEP